MFVANLRPRGFLGAEGSIDGRRTELVTPWALPDNLLPADKHVPRNAKAKQVRTEPEGAVGDEGAGVPRSTRVDLWHRGRRHPHLAPC